MNGARFFITGTDTDVGKTRVTAALARAIAGVAGHTVPVTIVKAVQTGLVDGEDGDAAVAARMAGGEVRWRELYRFRKPADPYAAALAEGREAPRAGAIVSALAEMPGALVVEGAGGAAVPLNAEEAIAEVAREGALDTIVAVGLRLGCINHALLTEHYLRGIGVRARGAVLVERWGPTPQDYRADVIRALAPALSILALMEFDAAAEFAVAQTAETLLTTLHLRRG